MKISYVGLGVADRDAWLAFGRDVLGLMPVVDGSDWRLRADEKVWRIAIDESSADDITYAGIEVGGAETVSEIRKRLEGAGVECHALSTAEADTRCVESGFWFRDPDGLRLELVHGLANAGTPFQSGAGASFVTGEEGLGHVVLGVSDLDRSIAFFEQVGFAISDFIVTPFGPDLTLRIGFLHCNSRHHSLALAQLPGGKRLNHIMLEMTDIDAVIRAHRRSTDLGFETGGLGRHTNDKMLSFYVKTPAGFDVECGADGCKIEDNWEVREYDAISLWGHERN